VRIAEGIKAQVREQVAAARALEGTHARLPSELAWAAQLHVTRSTLRRVLHDLEREGLLYPVTGKGWYVSG